MPGNIRENHVYAPVVCIQGVPVVSICLSVLQRHERPENAGSSFSAGDSGIFWEQYPIVIGEAPMSSIGEGNL